QLGGSNASLFTPPPTPGRPYPGRPAAVDDKDIQANEVLQQEQGLTTLMTGFNLVCDIYMTMNPIVSVDISYGFDSLKWPDQRQMLKDSLLAAKATLDNLPQELQLISPDPQTAGITLFDEP